MVRSQQGRFCGVKIAFLDILGALLGEGRAYVVSTLRTRTREGPQNRGDCRFGLLVPGAGVLEPGQSKVKAFKFATEAAITILRIDDMIKMQQDQKQENGYEKAMREGTLNG